MKRKAKQNSKEKSSKKLSEKAGLAMKNGFYLEATWIISLLFTRRLERIATLLNEKASQAVDPLDKWLRAVRQLQMKGTNQEVDKSISLELTDKIRLWKNNRNRVWKQLSHQGAESPRIQRIADEGVSLYKELNQSYKQLKSDIPAAEPKPDNPG